MSRIDPAAHAVAQPGTPARRARVAQVPPPGCVVLDCCDQCGRRMPQPHLVGGRVYCARCCPACASAAAEATRKVYHYAD